MSFGVETYTVEFSTSGKDEVKDLTKKVEEKIDESEVDDGICLIFAPHATGVLVLNENEKGIREDYLNGLYDIVPEDSEWKHDRIDNNAHSHLKSAIVGTDRAIPVTNGSLDLGTWQNIFFIETDGPRTRRKLILKLIGEVSS